MATIFYSIPYLGVDGSRLVVLQPGPQHPGLEAVTHPRHDTTFKIGFPTFGASGAGGRLLMVPFQTERSVAKPG